MINKKVIVLFAFLLTLVICNITYCAKNNGEITYESADTKTKNESSPHLSARLVWSRTWGDSGPGSEFGRGVDADSLGNVYVGGAGHGSAGNSMEHLLLKYDENGKYLWNSTQGQPYMDNGWDVAIDSRDNIYICGYTMEGTYTGYLNVSLVKFDSSGAVHWYRTWGSAGSDDQAYGITTDKYDNIYLTGICDTTEKESYGTAFLLKYNRAGDLLWEAKWTVGGGANRGEDVAVDRSGFVYVVGSNTSKSGIPKPWIFLSKFQNDGVNLWHNVWGSNKGGCQGFGVVTDQRNNVYITGFNYTSGYPNFHMILLKYSSSGVLQWVTSGDGGTYKNVGGYEIDIDSRDNLYIVGTIRVSDSNSDFIIFKYDKDGTFLWKERWGSVNENENGWGIKIVEEPINILITNVNIYVTGEAFRGNNWDVALVKYVERLGAPPPNDGKELWRFDTGGYVWSSPALGDVDDDGQLEVVVGSNDSYVYALNGENGSELWRFDTEDEVVSSPALGDVDGDGWLEAVVGSGNGRIYAINAENGTELWKFRTGEYVSSSPTLGDVDGDGWLEVVVGSENGYLYALNGEDGSELWKFNTGNKIEPGIISSSPALGDVDGDGRLEAVVGTIAGINNGYVFAINGKDGSELWKFKAGDRIRSSPALGDVNGDGQLEVVIGSTRGHVRALSGNNGSVLWLFNAGATVHSSPALGDVNGDGQLEAVLGSENGNVYALNAENGNELWSYHTEGRVHSSPALGDVDGDDKLEAVVGSYDGYIRALNGEGGSQSWRFDRVCKSANVVVGDVDGDGQLEAVMGGMDGDVVAFKPTSSGQRIYWQGFSGDTIFFRNKNLERIDSDSDMLSDYSEALYGTDSNDDDSDDDGYSDGEEINEGTDPLDPESLPGSGGGGGGDNDDKDEDDSSAEKGDKKSSSGINSLFVVGLASGMAVISAAVMISVILVKRRFKR
ncbi:MAG: FG-GAP-like repeat-containing protein [Promethearchaeota archaeon]